MSAFEEIMAELATLERRRLALFATGCAARARPVAAACGSPATADGFGETLEALWAGEGRLLAGPAAELLVLYDDAPENSAESSEESAYWAMSGVSLLAAALNAASPDGPDVAGWVCSGSINLHRVCGRNLQPCAAGDQDRHEGDASARSVGDR